MSKLVLITGAARRIGGVMAEHLHQHGMNIAIHCRHSKQQAQQLCDQLNQKREKSAEFFHVDFNQLGEEARLIKQVIERFGRLDVLINNASSFVPTPIGKVDIAVWNDLMNSNLRAPFFLAQAARNFLAEQKGCIINITDIYADRALKNYTVYCCAKAGLAMLTKSLAKELAPKIRVNAIAPNNILWPEGENELTQQAKQNIVEQTALRCSGSPLDIAKTAYYFIEKAPFVTGQILAVDGGRTL